MKTQLSINSIVCGWCSVFNHQILSLCSTVWEASHLQWTQCYLHQLQQWMKLPSEVGNPPSCNTKRHLRASETTHSWRQWYPWLWVVTLEGRRRIPGKDPVQILPKAKKRVEELRRWRHWEAETVEDERLEKGWGGAEKVRAANLVTRGAHRSLWGFKSWKNKHPMPRLWTTLSPDKQGSLTFFPGTPDTLLKGHLKIWGIQMERTLCGGVMGDSDAEGILHWHQWEGKHRPEQTTWNRPCVLRKDTESGWHFHQDLQWWEMRYFREWGGSCLWLSPNIHANSSQQSSSILASRLQRGQIHEYWVLMLRAVAGLHFL